VLAAVFIVSMVVAAMPGQSGAAPSPGSAGTDTSLPATDSQVTVSGRGQFVGLNVTVNQTADLVNQAVSLTWSGGDPTIRFPRQYSGNYLQVMQCWGEDDGSVPGNPGPPPEQCVQGAAASSEDGGVGDLFPPAGEEVGRTISKTTWANYSPTVGYTDPQTGRVWRPFRAVDGTVVNTHVNPNFNPAIAAGSYWLNPYFDIVTSNEIAGAATDSGGKGRANFEIATGVESSGLGCGQLLTPPAGGSPRVPKCWLVVVPRGTPQQENAGTPFEVNADARGVVTSPLSDSAWKNRIAIPLNFRPVDSACKVSANERRIIGTELVLPAMANWQPALCSSPGAPPYTYASVSDGQARTEIGSPSAGGPGMTVASRPIDPSTVDQRSPVVYAPLTLSGVVVGFSVDRSPTSAAPPEEQALGGSPVENINLTPRLLAKLLTQSYRSQVDISYLPSPYSWSAKNPTDLGSDPDFLQFNPEFALLNTTSRKNLGGLIDIGRNSDAASQVWAYVLSDPEARRWLDGEADKWGMKVNPVYATVAGANANGVAFGEPVPESFPKADPYCYQAPAVNGSVIPPALCGTDWLPYSASFTEAARQTRVGDDRAKIVANPFALSPDQVWKRLPPQVNGVRAMLSLTDSASAARYGIQTARLSRAGDDQTGRAFVRADLDGLTKAVQAMKVGVEQSVVEPDPLSPTPGAYPLAALSYGMIRPLNIDASARADYAAFVDYASGAGQVAGLKLGQLPPGYAPLPDALKAQAREAAVTIRSLQPVPESSSPSSGDAIPSTSGSNSTSSSASGRIKTPAAVTQTATASPTAVEPAAAASPQAGPLTPVLALARSRFLIPALAGIGLVSILAALEITKRPRRRTGAAATERS
jgi:hypothetical protein